MIGQTISHYRITEKLGEGGMGVVYKAEDTNLKRPVALKFLAAHLLGDQETKVRFRREAEAAAALSHANIAVIYDINESDGHSFIAMEFVEGLTVSKKAAERPLKLEVALDIATQATRGLQAAHEGGVVHRDIKSANLMVTPQGQVKIMDFGLAQLADRSKLTDTTTILGTPAYMSPEQVVGEKTDRRTDIWSLGVVLYEMLTGRLPFEGERQEAVLYGITNEEPQPVTALRAGLPMELEWIIGKALAKDREERYQHAEDLLVDLRSLRKKLASGKTSIVNGSARSIQLGQPIGGAQQLAQQRSSSRALLAAVALLALTSAVFAVLWLRSPVPAVELTHRTFALSLDTPAFWPSISPDGRYVTYLTKSSVSEPTLWVHDLSQDAPRALTGPGQEVWDIKPFWSPDSRFILFRAGQQLRRISVLGGAAVTVSEQLPTLTVGPWGGTLSRDGTSIVLSHVQGLYEIPAQGGEAELLVEHPVERNRLRWPHFLPGEEGSRKLLYVDFDRRIQEGRIVAHDLKSGQREILGSGFLPVYDPSGHIIFRTGEPPEIWSVPFSIDTLKVTGDPFPVRKNAARPSVAADGTLLYQQGGTAPMDALKQLVWRDRTGKTLGTVGQPQRLIQSVDLSPDEKRVAAQAVETYGQAIWIHEVDRPVKARLTTISERERENWEILPTWSPEGDRLVFSTGLPRNIFVRRSDGTGEPVQLTDSDGSDYLSQWSSDGKILFFERSKAEAGQQPGDLWYLRKKDEGERYDEVAFLQTPSNEMMPSLSPDGRVVAYVSDESGQEEVYLRTFPGGGGKRSVSPSGGTQPRWRADGKELFYVQGRDLMAVSVAAGPSLKLGVPEPLFSSEGLPWTTGHRRRYDVTRDGRRFVLAEPAERGSRTLRLVENWYEEFRDRKQD
jgi:serine/threonine protein kinase